MKEKGNSICKIINDINSKEEIKTIIFVIVMKYLIKTN